MKFTPLRALFVFLICILCVACGSTPAATVTPPSHVSLKVFAAASLTESFQKLEQSYQKTHPNVSITYNFAGSQVLEQQIANGAPSDIFASADTANMQKAQQAGLVNSSQIFAQNKLTVIIPVKNTAGITSLKDLAKHGIKIDIGTVAVPAGKYTFQILDKMVKDSAYGAAYKQAVLANVVSQEDNVKAVVQKVQLGEVDAGFVYQTDVTAAVASKVKNIEIPDTLNVVAQYPIAVTKHAAAATDAQAFVQYILSPEGQAILASYHFLAAQ